MSYLANKFYIGSGVGYGNTRLVAFDNALLDAGVGNYNLVRLSSILPIGALKNREDKIDLPLGSLLPIAYAELTSDKVGVSTVATVAIGVPVDKTKCCVIMEYEALGETASKAVGIVSQMVKDAFSSRGWELEQIIPSCAIAHPVRFGEKATAFACVAEWE